MVVVNIVGVTACPTGIAHSHMAAEALEREARERGHDVRIEVQGAMGAEDSLTADEIAAADVAVVAADVRVDTERFADLPLVEVPVGVGVNEPDTVLDRAVDAAGGSDQRSAAPETPDDGPSGPGGVLGWLRDRF